MILIALAIGLLAAIILGGHPTALLHARIRYAALILTAVALRFATQWLIGQGVDLVDALRVPLYATAFGVLIVCLWLNRAAPGLLIVLAGVSMNALAIIVNGGWMPVYLPAMDAAGLPLTDLSPTYHVVLPTELGVEFLLRLGPLGDVIPFPIAVLPNVVSVGDVVIGVGLAWFVFITIIRGEVEGSIGGVSLWTGPRAQGTLQDRPVVLGAGAGAGPSTAPIAIAGELEALAAPIPGGRSVLARARGHPYVRLARDGRFAAFWMGQTISVFGDRLNQVALGVLVLGLTGSVALSALVFVAAMLPNLVLGPIAGAFVDRWDHKRVMVWSDLARAGLVLLLPAAAAVEVWLVYPIVFAVTTISLFFRPARSAVLPRIVPKDDLLAANGAMWTGETIADIAGYPLAGLLVAFLGADLALAFWLDSVTYLASAFLLASIAVPPVTRMIAPRAIGIVRALVVDLHEGWRFLRDSPPLFQNTLVSIVGQLSVGATLALTPAYVYTLLGRPDAVDGAVPGLADTLGALEGVLGLGNLLAGFAIGAVGGRVAKGRLVIAGFVLMGLATVVLGLAGSVPLALAGAFVVGVANLVWLVPSQTLFGELVPGGLMGRVIAIRSSLVFGAMTGTAAVCTLIADVVPPGAIFAALGALTALAGVVGALLPAVRDA
jgi:MFS family permease